MAGRKLWNRETSQQTDVKIRVVCSGGDVKWKNGMETMAEAFMESNNGIKVELYFMPEKVYSLVENPGTRGGICYGVPVYSTTLGMIYNADIFERLGLSVPHTYEEFLRGRFPWLVRPGIYQFPVQGSVGP